MITLKIRQLGPGNTKDWRQFLNLYTKAFPRWERESPRRIEARIKSRHYAAFAGYSRGTIIGFYLLDISRSRKYILLSFLAVSSHLRGRGYGQRLCLDAINRALPMLSSAALLVTEAESRQAIFYARLGFKKANISYAVPVFHGYGTVPMHFMVIPRDGSITRLSGVLLRDIIMHVYTSGYSLCHSDVRLRRQLDRVPACINLLDSFEEDLQC